VKNVWDYGVCLTSYAGILDTLFMRAFRGHQAKNRDDKGFFDNGTSFEFYFDFKGYIKRR
jgi:hypothetical protein